MHSHLPIDMELAGHSTQTKGPLKILRLHGIDANSDVLFSKT